jgi:hypothetical protein
MKTIKIDICRHCPLRQSYFCTHESADGMRIDNLDIIDPNCPLEDFNLKTHELLIKLSDLIEQFRDGEIDEDDSEYIKSVLNEVNLCIKRG